MTGRHARTNRPPSRTRSFVDRWAQRPVRVSLALVSSVAIAAPMVAAQPLSAPAVDTELAVESTTQVATAASTGQRTDRPGQGPINTVGLASILVANHSSNKAGSTATEMGAAAIAAREAAAAEAARQAAEAEAAARAAEQEAARREAARQAEAQRAAEAAAAPAPAPAVSTGSAWDRLAQCESGGNWGINTGNGYYGGLQFSLASWRGVGGTGYPHQASRETQIAMGERLKAQGGWGHWPACSRKLGLR